jgi:glyoxylase-like metal-dependent hydrolase (beta-lactamase superfamily II)
MHFRQLFDPTSSTYTYLLGCPQTGEAILIDPVLAHCDRDAAVIKQLGLKLSYTVETHVHADHITSARKLKAMCGSKIAGPSGEEVPCYDLHIQEGSDIIAGSVRLQPLHTPGHTATHFAFVCDDGTHTMAFTGDALLIDGCGRTDFQAGDASALYHSITRKLFTLPDETLVYPGHDYQGRTVSSIGQEKTRNPRLGGGRTLAEFVAIMAALKLPNPMMMDYAVPGNLTCGQCPPNIPPELKGPCEIEHLYQG